MESIPSNLWNKIDLTIYLIEEQSKLIPENKLCDCRFLDHESGSVYDWDLGSNPAYDPAYDPAHDPAHD